ncbi:MAG: spore germination protein [Christensenellales bacterium]|jgi:spore germination protein KA
MIRLLKKLRFRKKNKNVEDRVGEWNEPLESCKLSSSLDKNLEALNELLRDVDIVCYKPIQAGEKGAPRCLLVFFDGVVNSQIINDHIMKPLMDMQATPDGPLMDALLNDVVLVGESRKVDSFSQIIQSITYGDTVLLADGSDQAATFNTKQFAIRSVDEPDNEKVLSGPREGFTECLMQNISQVLRRLRTHEFKVKALTLGRRTNTSVCVCYIDSLVDKDALDQLLDRLYEIDIDGVLDSNYITEFIREHRYTPFRVTGYTERPDVVSAKLLEGRIAIMVDGSPIVLTVPYLFIENFQSAEDYYFNFYYSSFARILRVMAFFLTIAVPGLYIAITAFHQAMLPLQLLIKIALERQNVPLPAAVEAVIMLLVFDILRETGIRMPSNIGQALSIVGALVIGQAAVEASLVAAPMIIVVAATGITSLLVPRLNAPIIYWRLILLAFASTFGFAGLAIALSLLLIHISNLTSFGVEQIALEGSFKFQKNKDTFIRAPWWAMIDRPERLSRNRKRQPEENSND